MLERLREFLRPFYLRNIYFPLFPKRKPPYFDTCWKFPTARLDSHSTLPVIIFLPMNDWHTRMQRTQQLALALAKLGYRCVYLNPHLGREFPRRFRAATSSQVTQLRPNLFELHVHLPHEPVFHHRLLTASETGLIADAMTHLLNQLGATRTVQVVSLPVWLNAARSIRQSNAAPIIYDCHDYLPGFSAIAPAILQTEPELFRSSDLVICSAQGLMERAQSLGTPAGHCVLIRNAAATEFFQTPSTHMAAAGPVRIGYVGALDSWFDAESIQTAARAHPEWQFHLVGRVENQAVRNLGRLPNIYLPGEVGFSQLPEILASFTVATIPFLLNPLIRATDPIKVYEYLATGLPIVSSNLPELTRFGDLIARYGSSSDFVGKLELAIDENSHTLVNRRRAAASLETWEQRANQLVREIEALLSRTV